MSSIETSVLAPTQKQAESETCASGRAASVGHFAFLPQGETHYCIEGEGQPLVLIHGATVGLWEYDLLVPHLHAAGYQTIRYDLYGHGISARPRGPYTLELYRQQLLDLLDILALDQPPLFVGHSMGAAILAAALGQNSIPKTRAVLLAPLLEHASRIALRPLLKTPVLGELLIQTLGRAILSERRKQRLRQIGLDALIPKYLQQIEKSGHWRSMRRVICDGALDDQMARYLGLAQSEHQLALLWGEDDAIITAADIAGIRAALGEHRYESFRGMAHNFLLTHPQLLAQAICIHLKSC